MVLINNDVEKGLLASLSILSLFLSLCFNFTKKKVITIASKILIISNKIYLYPKSNEKYSEVFTTSSFI